MDLHLHRVHFLVTITITINVAKPHNTHEEGINSINHFSTEETSPRDFEVSGQKNTGQTCADHSIFIAMRQVHFAVFKVRIKVVPHQV